MAARAMWKGVIRFGDAEVPVKLYSAAQDRSVHFRLLHEKDRVPVRQQMVDPATGESVPYEKTRRGFQTDEGVFVVLTEEELAELEPEPSRDIEVTRFLEPDRIGHEWYDRPYFLGPDGNPDAYFALAHALGGRGREGLARWTMRKKEYVGALRAEGPYLTLMTLRRAGEVVPASALPRPRGRTPDRKELDMAKQLLAALEDDFDPTEFRDEYRDRVLELIAAKAEGKTVKLPPAPGRREEPEEDLAALLQASLEGARSAA